MFLPRRQPSAEFLRDHLEPLARKPGFIVRRTKGFSASGFVLSLINPAITGNASFNELALKRRRERGAKAHQSGKEASKDMLIRAGLYILATIVDSGRMTSESIFKLYSIRWQVERTLRTSKRSGKLMSALAGKSNQAHLQALMLA